MDNQICQMYLLSFKICSADVKFVSSLAQKESNFTVLQSWARAAEVKHLDKELFQIFAHICNFLDCSSPCFHQFLADSDQLHGLGDGVHEVVLLSLCKQVCWTGSGLEDGCLCHELVIGKFLKELK